MPHVNDTDKLTGSWFCPGLPASGEEGVGGEVVVSNRDGEQLVGRFSVLTPDGVAATQDFTVEPWSRDDHRRRRRWRRAVRECHRRTRRWGRPRRAAGPPPGRRFGGPVLERHVRHVVLRRRVHRRRQRGVAHPVQPVRRRGDRPVDVRHRVGRVVAVGIPRLPDPAALGEGDPDRRARRPRRAGHRRRGDHDERADRARAGAALPRWRTTRLRGHARRPGAARPVLVRRRRAGRRASPRRIAIYNPTDADVEVDAVFLGLPVEANFGGIPTITVPSRRVVVFDPTDEQFAGTVPDGRHAVVFSTLADPSIVVERVLTRPADDSVATTVVARRTAARGRVRRHPVASRHRARRADDRPRSSSTTSTTSREPSRSRRSARAVRRRSRG